MLTDIEKVRVIIGDTPNTPYYPILEDEDIQFFLDSSGGNYNQAAKRAARAAMFQIASTPTKEYANEVEVWNVYASEYRKALEYLLKDSYILPDGLMPYFAGIDWDDVCKYIDDPTIYVDPLKRIAVCNAKRECRSC